MSPEQAEGRKVDARSDIFSLGAVLYEMATGQRAFPGSSKISTLAAILHTEPKPAAEVQPGVPPELASPPAVPAQRPGVALSLRRGYPDRTARAAARSRERNHARAPAPPAARRALWPVIAIVAAVAAAGAGWWVGSRGERPHTGPIRPLTTYPWIRKRAGAFARWQPGGFLLGWREGRQHRHLRAPGGRRRRAQAHHRSAPDRCPAWSPDSRRLAFVRGNAIYLIPALGGEERKLVQFSKGKMGASGGPHLQPDFLVAGWQAAGIQRKRFGRLGGDMGGPYRGRRAGCHHETSDGNVRRRRGRFLSGLLSRRHKAGIHSRSRTVQPRHPGASHVRRHPEGRSARDNRLRAIFAAIEWAADGHSLIAALHWPAESLWRLDLNGKLARLGVGEDAAWPSVSRTAKRLAYEKHQLDTNIYRLDGPGPEGGPQPFERCHLSRVIDSTAVEREPMLSPDGRRLLFNSERWGAAEIHVADSDGSHQTALTSMGPTSMGSPRWSPDGSTVVFDRYEHGHSAIYTISAEGGKPRKMTGDDTSDIRPSFSRDGKWIYFSSYRSGTTQVWKMPAGGGTAQQVTHDAAGADAFESPDGRDLYYYTPGGLCALPLAGGEPRLVLPEVNRPRYALAGRSIYYLTISPPAVWVYRLDSGRKFEYVRFPAGAPSDLHGGHEHHRLGRRARHHVADGGPPRERSDAGGEFPITLAAQGL